MTPNNLLRTGLVANAALSLTLGALLAMNPAAISDRLDVSGVDGWLRALGVALLFHAGFLAWVQRLDRPAPWVWTNLAVIAPYPIAMAALAASGVVEPFGGKVLLLLDGALVATVAVLQWVGVRRREISTRTATASA